MKNPPALCDPCNLGVTLCRCHTDGEKVLGASAGGCGLCIPMDEGYWEQTVPETFQGEITLA